MTIKTYLSSEEIQAIIDKASCLRDKVIISFYADTGCRVSELLKVKPEHIDLENKVVLIPHLKRGIRKRCPTCKKSAGRSQKFCSKCGSDLRNVFAEGIEERSRLINIGDATCSIVMQYIESARPKEYLIDITRQRIYGIVRELAAAIGIKGKAILNPDSGKKHFVHPHSFRDSLAISWLSVVGTDVSKQKALQEHLGHLSFNTTMRYNKLTPENVKRVADEVRKARSINATNR